MPTAYCNGLLFTGDTLVSGKALLTDNGTITGRVASNEVPSDYTRFDLKGAILSPAFIDLQIYGGNGHMFHEDITRETLDATDAYCRAGGAGYFMITLATNTLEVFHKSLEVARQYLEKGSKALLGVHLEGPYLNPVKRGAHIEALIKKPVRSEIEKLLQEGEGVFRMMTLAPECCDPALVRLLQDNGILVSAGHSNATYAQATAAFNSGIPVATHFYNAMSALQHRAPGMVGAILDHPSVKSSVVCDGIHADFAAVRIAKQVLGDRLFYITDAVAEVKTGAYQHLFKGDHYALPDGTLSGSALTMMKCVENGVKHLGLNLDASLRMATSIPGSLVSFRKIGRLEAGYEACFTVMNDAFEVLEVIN